MSVKNSLHTVGLPARPPLRPPPPDSTPLPFHVRDALCINCGVLIRAAIFLWKFPPSPSSQCHVDSLSTGDDTRMNQMDRMENLHRFFFGGGGGLELEKKIYTVLGGKTCIQGGGLRYVGSYVLCFMYLVIENEAGT